MAIAFDAHASNSAGSGTTVSATHTVGSGNNRLVVAIMTAEHSAARNHDSVTYNSVAMNKVVEEDVSDNIGSASLWYMNEDDLPSTGSYTVAGTMSDTCSNIIIIAVSFTGVHQVAPEASNSSSVTGADTISTSLTTIASNAWVIDGVHHGDHTIGGFDTTESGQTERGADEVNTSSVGATSSKAVATPGSTTMGWDPNLASGNRMAHVLASFAPSVDVTVTPSAQALTFTLETITTQNAELSPVGAMTLTIESVALLTTHIGSAFNLTLTLESPTVVTDATPSPAAQSLTLTLESVTISLDGSITATPDALALTGAVLATTPDITLLPSSLSGTLTITSPTFTFSGTESVNALALTLSLLDVTILGEKARKTTIKNNEQFNVVKSNRIANVLQSDKTINHTRVEKELHAVSSEVR